MAKLDTDKQTKLAIGERARRARIAAGISLVDMGRRLGFKAPQGYSRHEKGERNYKPQHLALIARICNVRLEWLARGVGEMRGADQSARAIAAADMNLDQELEDLPLKPPHPARAQNSLPSKPIRDLWNCDVVGIRPITEAEVAFLEHHLLHGQSDLASLEIALRGYRVSVDDSDENLEAYIAAVKRRRLEEGMRDGDGRGRHGPDEPEPDEPQTTTHARTRREH